MCCESYLASQDLSDRSTASPQESTNGIGFILCLVSFRCDISDRLKFVFIERGKKVVSITSSSDGPQSEVVGGGGDEDVMVADEGSSLNGESRFLKIGEYDFLVQIPQPNVVDIQEAFGGTVHGCGLFPVGGKVERPDQPQIGRASCRERV